MSTLPTAVRRITVPEIQARKGSAPLVVLTAYTAPIARAVDQVSDLIIVGDSLGMVLYGMDNPLAVTVEMMIAHGSAVTRSTRRACIVVDLPFGSYQASPEQAFTTAARVIVESGCTAVKLEGGAEMAATVRYLVERGIPVMGHVGMQPQSMHRYGGFRAQGKEADARAKILADAKAIAEAGAFALVLEAVYPQVAEEVTKAIPVPIIGIGATAICDGQVLVTEDMVGLTQGPAPRFVKKYADLSGQLAQAVQHYSEEVKARRFPAAAQHYGSKA